MSSAKGKVVNIDSFPIPAPLPVIVLGGVGTGIAWVLHQIGLEPLLQDVLPGNPSVWFSLMAFVTLYVNNFLGALTVRARNRYGVGHPLVYPNKGDLNNGRGGTAEDRISFICQVRGHGNFLEYMSTLALGLLALAYYADQPCTATLLGLISGTTRMFYGWKYGTGIVKSRMPAFLGHVVAYYVTQGLLILYFLDQALYKVEMPTD